MSKKKVLSGVRPTGRLHVGNYFGAIKNFVSLQETHDCYFFIADYHALTTHPNPQDLKKSSLRVLAEYLACGIDPLKAVMYKQSALKEIAELYLVFNTFAYLGELERCTSFKEKVRKQPDNVNVGLLTYPTLMAADILIHNPDFVPVGKDQEQHLEMTRTFANRFNNFHKKEVFKAPQAFNFGDKLVKVPGLDGSGKMGKSEGNAIYLSDTNDDLKKKIMRAVTDSGPTEKNQTKPEAIENLFTLFSLFSSAEKVAQYEDAYNHCTIRYGDMKKQLLEDVVAFIEPLRKSITEIEKDQEMLEKVLREGVERARENASGIMKQIHELYGF